MQLHGIHLTCCMYLMDGILFIDDNLSQNLCISTRWGDILDVSMYKLNIHDQIHPLHNQAGRQ